MIMVKVNLYSLSQEVFVDQCRALEATSRLMRRGTVRKGAYMKE